MLLLLRHDTESITYSDNFLCGIKRLTIHMDSYGKKNFRDLFSSSTLYIDVHKELSEAFKKALQGTFF